MCDEERSSSPVAGSDAAMSPSKTGAQAVVGYKALCQEEQAARVELRDEAQKELTVIEVEFLTREQQLKKASRDAAINMTRQRVMADAARQKLLGQRVALIVGEQQNRAAIERLAEEDAKQLFIDEHNRRFAMCVPRLSHVKRSVAQGSPTALVHRQIREDRRQAKLRAAAAEEFSLSGADETRSLSSNSFALLPPIETSVSLEATQTGRLRCLLADLQSSRRSTVNHTSATASGTSPRSLLLIKSDMHDTASWVGPSADEVVIASAVRNAIQVLQRVGRGFLLRSAICSLNTSTRSRRTVLFESGSFEDFARQGKAKKQKSVRSLPGSVYKLQRLGVEKLSRLIQDEAEAAAFHDRSAHQSSRKLQRSASAFFLKSKDSAPAAPATQQQATRELLRLQLTEVDLQMKKRMQELDKRTRELQAMQDVKMMQLAHEEAQSKERYRQMMAGLRDRARIVRQQQREDEHHRELEAQLRVNALHREYEVKRVELHVELREKFMKEDHVTALRNTLSELGNVSHLSASVPSLNLTRAMKEAHFESEGLNRQSFDP